MGNLSLAIDHRGVAQLTINRPQVHNAFDDELIADLLQQLQSLSTNEDVRILSLTGAGASFSAGADLNWMRRARNFTAAQNMADANRLASMLRTLDEFPQPTLAIVNGATFGGGVGLVAACDVAIASTKAVFSLSEVLLGLVPATISPYVVAAIGQRAARRFYLTGERFNADTARTIGLVHDVVQHEDLASAGDELIATFLTGGPKAQSVAKSLIRETGPTRDRDHLDAWTAQLIADIRKTNEAAEGLTAFFEKRPPAWRQ
ncbi:MAG: enoyl-CoA hydratase-related protein [Pseudomonadota bacterium]|jgi:methylglutaconyl-CoA hydratase|nr:enoyl-CoA hydratase-related protein [Pseudomonadota bacterium]